MPSSDQTEVQHVNTGVRAEKGMAQRIKARDLFKQWREVEIDHEGKIYRLRLTQANKLILTA
jgi:hemin uptake protein HemP